MELIFTFIIVMLIYVEYKNYRTLLTPFSLIAIVYTTLILVNNFVVSKMGFYKVSAESIFYILCFLILIFFISMCFFFLFKKKSNIMKENINRYVNNVIYSNKKLIVILDLLGLIASYFSLFQVFEKYGLNNIKGKAFGIFAHIGILAIILTPYIMILYIHNKKKIQYLILILLTYLNLFLFGGKYGIIIAFIHLVNVYAMIKNVNTKKAIKLGMILIFFSILTFIIVYAVKPIIILGYFNKNLFLNSMYFSLMHFMSYLMGPIIATNYYFNNAAGAANGIQILFTVPINIVKALFRMGNYINPIYSNFISISAINMVNVGGLFAESVYCSGFLIATIYIGIFFCVVYYYYVKARYNGEMISLASLMLAVVTVMFFCNFLTVSGVVLRVLYLWIIELILKKKIVLKR